MKHFKISIIKKVFLVLMSVVASLMIVLNISINHSNTEFHSDAKPVVFSNNFYNTTLNEPGVDPVHDVVPMNDLYQILLDNLVIASKDDLTPSQIQQLDALDSHMTQLIDTATLNKWVSITTAEELYQFSNAQSINFNQQAGTNTYIYENTIKKVLDLNYILLSDINYSSMRSRKFVPIGTNILLESQEIGAGGNIEIYMPFTGVFDGNGFVISNLYLADFAYITTTFQEDEGSTAVTASLFKEYGMFAAIGETGVVKNFILRNPIYEVLLIDSSNGLFSFAMLAGHNDGSIYNVGIIDEKRTQQGSDNTGIIVNIRYPSTESYNAAGFVYQNSGEIYNSYFVSDHIVQEGSMFLFDVVAPFVYDNTGGVINGASYISDLEVKKPANFNFYQGSGLEEYTATQLKNGSEINLNDEDLDALTINSTPERVKWFFYEADGYPRFEGFDPVDGVYEIYNEYDFIYFSKVINLLTYANDPTAHEKKFVLKNSINMINIKGYQTPSRDFKGMLTGNELGTDFDVNDPATDHDNNYIYNLEITKPYVIGNNYYLGLFSVLSGTVTNINFYNNKVHITTSENHYGKNIHVGMVAGKMNTTANIKNVISASNIDLGHEAIGTVYAGGIVGSGSGTIMNVANIKQGNIGQVDGGIHNFNNRNLIPNFYLGGIVGTNNTSMQIHNALNTADIIGISSLNNEANYTGHVQSFTGGIIGEIHNSTATGSSLKHLTNKGKITAGTVPGKVGYESKNFAGGIFGSISGYGFKSANGTQLRNGRFENSGVIAGAYINVETYQYLAGIGVANTDQVESEISYVVNSAGFDIDGLDYKTYNKYIYYAATVIDNTTQGITLSRAYNTHNFTFEDTFFVSDKTEITDSDNLITPDYSEHYNFSQSNYTANPNNLNVYSTNGSLYGNVSKQNNVGYRFVASNSPQRYLEIRNLNLRGNFTIFFDVLRNETINNINFNVELIGSNQPIYEYEGIANGEHLIELTNLSSDNAVHTIRLTKISGNGTLDLRSIRIEQHTPIHSIDIAPFFTSIHNAHSTLKYVENTGALTVGHQTSISTVTKQLRISNITQANRVDYYNVINKGKVSVLNIENTVDSVYVAGITWILPYDERPFEMINVLNEGDIVTAAFKGNTTVSGSVTGQSFSHTTFSSNLNVRNLYVAGLVNINVGHILNSMNVGTITSKYSEVLSGIHGTANTFVGGINTFNYNLIQDAANTGLIEYTNESTQSVSYFAATTNISTSNNSTFGGISITYTGGLVLGGIVGALGDKTATILTGHKNFGSDQFVAEVVDTSNNGDIYGKAKEYVRSGGILGIALSVELASGTYANTSSNVTPGTFTTAAIGSGDPIGQSLLSNGLNFGNIYAVTQNIGSYADQSGIVQTGNNINDSRHANSLRPGINASAGGVVGYGLTRMVRMLNHGVISSTDVAGGIIGSTYILGGANQQSTPITTVEINTAVNYGKIRAIKTGYFNSSRRYIYEDNRYNSFNYNENENFENSNRYYLLNEYDNFILYRATSNYLIETYQQGRRGFGGIFGRLQRGNYGTMRSTEFKNIMNMDKDIDMIGRVDSNQHGSLVYYRFFTGEETYFTAKEKDTTPNAFAGWKYNSLNVVFQNSSIEFTVRRTGSVYYVQNIRVISGTVTVNETVYKVGMTHNGTSTGVVTQSTTSYPVNSGYILQGNTNTGTQYRVAAFGLTSSHYGSISNNNSRTFTVTSYSRNVSSLNSSTGTEDQPPTNEAYRYPIQWVSDDPTTLGALNIFDPSFPLMRQENSEYIYPVDNDALAPRFRSGANIKPNGMYVLSSSTGSIDGAALPTNITISDLYRLNENLYEYINLDDVPSNKKIIPDELDESGIVYKYQQMYQLSYNNKSEVLAEDENLSTKISELVLYDPNGNSPTLQGGEIVRGQTNSITYRVSADAFNAMSPNTFYYEVLYNELSQGAVIAKTNLSTSEYNQLRIDYNRRVNDILPGSEDIQPSAVRGIYQRTSTTNWPGNQVSFTLRVYSEIYVKDPGIGLADQKYYTDYTVYIIKSNTNLTMDATINLNNTNSDHNSIGTSLTINNRQMPPTGNLSALFQGTTNAVNNLIPNHHEMTIHNLYLGSVHINNRIEPEFYELELIKKGSISGNDNQFGFNIILSDELQSGNYIIEYSYYDTSVKRTITFNKRASNEVSIQDLSYETYSLDQLGTTQDFTTQSTNFKTYVEFGYLFGLTSQGQTPLTIEFETRDNFQSYEDEIDYYTLKLDSRTIIKNLKLAPFLRLISAQMTYRYINQAIVTSDPTLTSSDIGKVQYLITYQIELENGTSQTIVQTIEERNPKNMLVYSDDNLLTSTSFDITREAFETRVDIDFNLITPSLYQQIKVEQDGIGLDGIYSPEASVYFGDNDLMFNLILTAYLDVGSKTYDFIVTREGIAYNLGSLEINKLEGVSAYLLDIRYPKDDEPLLIYPIIRASDHQGIPNDTHDTRVYFNGIDYDTAITVDPKVKHFRIDGKVADTVLESYAPTFTAPYGATIYRYVGTGNPETDQLDTSNTSKWSTTLEADYVGQDDEVVVVVYMVVSENEAEHVFYHITVEDIEYNLTLRFSIYYEYEDSLGQLQRIPANDHNSPIKNSVVLISLRNLKMRQLSEVEQGQFLTTGPLVSNFPTVLDSDIVGYNNQSSLYYFVGMSSTINYRFGRNTTGIYNFNIITPKYQGPQTDDLTPGQRYHYEMYMNLYGETNYYQEKYHLPWMSQRNIQMGGIFYAISSPSSNPISRELVIVIKNTTQSPWWGLYDDYTSWDD